MAHTIYSQTSVGRYSISRYSRLADSIHLHWLNPLQILSKPRSLIYHGIFEPYCLKWVTRPTAILGVLSGKMPSKVKKSITATQRKALWMWFFQQNPWPSQKACIDWYKNQYGHELSQSSVSDLLSNCYKNLDTIDPSPSIRNRTGAREDLEIILYEWQKTIELQGGQTTGDLLVEKAHEIWRSLPQYENLPESCFSAGWLHHFKKRFNIKQHNYHGEVGSVSEEAEEEMAAIQTLSGQYMEDDIYNMDETDLFWCLSSSRSLSTQARTGVWKDKSRISLICGINASGTDCLPIWFIGKYQTSQALQNINIQAMRGRWHWNKKAWMDTMIMKEWLLFFYSHIGPWTVLLTLDNFPAHLSGLELAPPPSNVRIQWLPSNSTSRFQSLDRGIIQNLKIYYWKQWLRHMLNAYENFMNPMNTVTILDTIHWVLRAWNHGILPTTINNCFRKSTLVSEPVQLPIESPDLTALFAQVQHAGVIEDAIAISNFLNPTDESDQLIASHTATNWNGGEDEESETLPLIPKVSEALQAVRLLISYTESQDDSETSTLRVLERYERDLERNESSLTTQGTLTRWMA